MASAQTTVYPIEQQPEARLVELDGRLERGWERLAGRTGSPIESFAWARACAETIASHRRPVALVVGALTEPVAIAPLATRSGPLSPLELIGVVELGEPMDLLYADDAGAVRLARALARTKAALDLRRVPVDSAVVAAIEHAYQARGVLRVSPAGSCPFILLDEGWNEPERQLSSRRRADLRRGERRAQQLGELTWEMLNPGPASVDESLREAFRVEAASWKGKSRTALAHDESRAAFYRRYAGAIARLGILRICLLRIGGEPAAMQLAVESGDRFWLLKIGYDEEYSRCSPGSLLLQRTIRYAATRRLRAYEFLGQSSDWTRVWTRAERRCVRLRAYPLAGAGLGRLARDAAGAGGRRFARAVGKLR
jgi:CelD/BcsL family acetyltransferase involved in cellulose biosynthesis